MCACLNPVWGEHQDDTGPPPGRLLAEIAREAAHLTRRDGKRRVVLQWGSEPVGIELVERGEVAGVPILSSTDIG